MSKISEQLEYKKQIYVHPTYKLNKILPIGGVTTQSVSPQGLPETIFELPVYAMNLAQSFITFQFRIPQLAANFNNVFKDCFPHWRQIQLYTRSGIYMCDLNELQNYTKITFNCETRLEEFLDLDYMTGVDGGTDGPPPTFPGATANPAVIGAGYHFHRSGVIKTDFQGNAARPGIDDVFNNDAALTGNDGAGTDLLIFNSPFNPTESFPIDVPVINANIINWVVTGQGDTPAASYLDYTEPSYVYRTTNVNEAITMNVQIPLHAIKNTILSVDKNIYFGEIILLKIIWGPGTKIAFTNTSRDNLHDGAVALAATIAVQNIALYLAVEKNQEIINELRGQIAGSGFSVLIPYVSSYNNLLNGINQNLSLRFNRGHGRRLLKIYHSIFNSTEQSDFAYDHSNINGEKCSVYYTLLNNDRLQEYDIDCTQLDDYNLLRPYLKDKVLQTSNIYQYNWFHMESFDGYCLDNSNLESGLDLEKEQKWDIYCTTANDTFRHYVYAVTQKMLTISSSGITVI